MSDVPIETRWYQLKLRDIFVATFWIAVACSSAMMIPVGPLWMFVTAFSSVSAFWSLLGRYWNVLITWLFAALLFLLLVNRG